MAYANFVGSGIRGYVTEECAPGQAVRFVRELAYSIWQPSKVIVEFIRTPGGAKSFPYGK